MSDAAVRPGLRPRHRDRHRHRRARSPGRSDPVRRPSAARAVSWCSHTTTRPLLLEARRLAGRHDSGRDRHLERRRVRPPLPRHPRPAASTSSSACSSSSIPRSCCATVRCPATTAPTGRRGTTTPTSTPTASTAPTSAARSALVVFAQVRRPAGRARTGRRRRLPRARAAPATTATPTSPATPAAHASSCCGGGPPRGPAHRSPGRSRWHERPTIGRARTPARGRKRDLDVELRCRPAREPRRLRLLRPLHGAGHLERRDRQPPADRRLDPCRDARAMDAGTPALKPNSVALVVTSPPYFAGKDYEEALGDGHIPASYLEYLEMLRDVFAECARQARARRPHRGQRGQPRPQAVPLACRPTSSASSQDDLGLLLRGEIIWRKGEGASGNCAWGSFQSAANPVLRDLTERVVVASKGRFDRAARRSPSARAATCPYENTISKTTSWTGPPTCGTSTRERQPRRAPGAVPGRAAPAAHRALHLPRRPRARPVHGLGHAPPSPPSAPIATTSASTSTTTTSSAPRSAGRGRAARADPARDVRRAAPSVVVRARRTTPCRHRRRRRGRLPGPRRARGRMAKELADELLEDAGFEEIAVNKQGRGGRRGQLRRQRPAGHNWFFDVSGAFTEGNDRAGLRRTDTLWKALGKAAVLHESNRRDSTPYRLVLLTTDLPPSSERGRRGAARRVRGRQARLRRGRDARRPTACAGSRRYAEHGPDGLPPGT